MKKHPPRYIAERVHDYQGSAPLTEANIIRQTPNNRCKAKLSQDSKRGCLIKPGSPFDIRRIESYRARIFSASQLAHSSTPSPLVAEMGKMGACGFRLAMWS